MNVLSLLIGYYHINRAYGFPSDIWVEPSKPPILDNSLWILGPVDSTDIWYRNRDVTSLKC